MASVFNRPHGSSKPDKNLKKVSAPSLPSAKGNEGEQEDVVNEEEIKKISAKEGRLTVEEALKLIKNLEIKGRQVKEKIEELFAIRGVSPEYLRSYMSNPNNFTTEEWENLKKYKESYLKNLNVPPNLAHVTKELMGEGTSSLNSSERRSKLGRSSRRRWWLHVR